MHHDALGALQGSIVLELRTNQNPCGPYCGLPLVLSGYVGVIDPLRLGLL